MSTCRNLDVGVSLRWYALCRHFSTIKKVTRGNLALKNRLLSNQLNGTYDPPIPPSSVPCDANSNHHGWKPTSDETVPGFEVPTRFRIGLHQHTSSDRKMSLFYSRDTNFNYTYTDYSGLRFPTLDTSENKDYWKDTGLNRLLPRVFPVKLPTHRKIDPLMREYIFFLHNLDPRRFTGRRISERYGFKESTILKVIKEFSLLNFILHNRLCNPHDRRITLEEARLQLKEQAFRDNLGYIHVSDEVDQEEHSFKGFEDTADWIYRQSVQVEGLSAFPLPSTRDPMPKRVDVDLTVKHSKHLKVINWIDPSDKVVF
uniref:Uncharacterized protein n=1 Tax=Babesia bovis TaxID=5865 RepID=S6B2U0_BABBO|nr:hypothetical protein [Babesia bovis]